MSDQVIFWDIDGTLIESTLENHFLFFLFRKKYISKWKTFKNVLKLSFRLPRPAWYQIKAAYLKDHLSQSVSGWIEECWEESIKPSIPITTVQAVKNLHDLGVKQILLSGTLRQLAEPLGRFLHITDIITGEPEIRNGRYTGSLVAPHPKGLRKAKMAEKWLKNNGCDWDLSAAAGNHWTDRFLLERVKTAVAMRPDKRLKRLAQKHNWPVIENPESQKEILKAFAFKKF